MSKALMLYPLKFILLLMLVLCWQSMSLNTNMLTNQFMKPYIVGKNFSHKFHTPIDDKNDPSQCSPYEPFFKSLLEQEKYKHFALYGFPNPKWLGADLEFCKKGNKAQYYYAQFNYGLQDVWYWEYAQTADIPIFYMRRMPHNDRMSSNKLMRYNIHTCFILELANSALRKVALADSIYFEKEREIVMEVLGEAVNKNADFYANFIEKREAYRDPGFYFSHWMNFIDSIRTLCRAKYTSELNPWHASYQITTPLVLWKEKAQEQALFIPVGHDFPKKLKPQDEFQPFFPNDKFSIQDSPLFWYQDNLNTDRKYILFFVKTAVPLTEYFPFMRERKKQRFSNEFYQDHLLKNWRFRYPYLSYYTYTPGRTMKPFDVNAVVTSMGMNMHPLMTNFVDIGSSPSILYHLAEQIGNRNSTGYWEDDYLFTTVHRTFMWIDPQVPQRDISLITQLSYYGSNFLNANERDNHYYPVHFDFYNMIMLSKFPFGADMPRAVVAYVPQPNYYERHLREFRRSNLLDHVMIGVPEAINTGNVKVEFVSFDLTYNKHYAYMACVNTFGHSQRFQVSRRNALVEYFFSDWLKMYGVGKNSGIFNDRFMGNNYFPKMDLFNILPDWRLHVYRSIVDIQTKGASEGFTDGASYIKISNVRISLPESSDKTSRLALRPLFDLSNGGPIVNHVLPRGSARVLPLSTTNRNNMWYSIMKLQVEYLAFVGTAPNKLGLQVHQLHMLPHFMTTCRQYNFMGTVSNAGGLIKIPCHDEHMREKAENIDFYMVMLKLQERTDTPTLVGNAMYRGLSIRLTDLNENSVEGVLHRPACPEDTLLGNDEIDGMVLAIDLKAYRKRLVLGRIVHMRLEADAIGWGNVLGVETVKIVHGHEITQFLISSRMQEDPKTGRWYLEAQANTALRREIFPDPSVKNIPAAQLPFEYKIHEATGNSDLEGEYVWLKPMPQKKWSIVFVMDEPIGNVLIQAKINGTESETYTSRIELVDFRIPKQLHVHNTFSDEDIGTPDHVLISLKLPEDKSHLALKLSALSVLGDVDTNNVRVRFQVNNWNTAIYLESGWNRFPLRRGFYGGNNLNNQLVTVVEWSSQRVADKKKPKNPATLSSPLHQGIKLHDPYSNVFFRRYHVPVISHSTFEFYQQSGRESFMQFKVEPSHAFEINPQELWSGIGENQNLLQHHFGRTVELEDGTQGIHYSNIAWSNRLIFYELQTGSIKITEPRILIEVDANTRMNQSLNNFADRIVPEFLKNSKMVLNTTRLYSLHYYNSQLNNASFLNSNKSSCFKSLTFEFTHEEATQPAQQPISLKGHYLLGNEVITCECNKWKVTTSSKKKILMACSKITGYKSKKVPVALKYSSIASLTDPWNKKTGLLLASLSLRINGDKGSCNGMLVRPQLPTDKLVGLELFDHFIMFCPANNQIGHVKKVEISPNIVYWGDSIWVEEVRLRLPWNRQKVTIRVDKYLKADSKEIVGENPQTADIHKTYFKNIEPIEDLRQFGPIVRWDHLFEDYAVNNLAYLYAICKNFNLASKNTNSDLFGRCPRICSPKQGNPWHDVDLPITVDKSWKKRIVRAMFPQGPKASDVCSQIPFALPMSCQLLGSGIHENEFQCACLNSAYEWIMPKDMSFSRKILPQCLPRKEVVMALTTTPMYKWLLIRIDGDCDQHCSATNTQRCYTKIRKIKTEYPSDVKGQREELITYESWPWVICECKTSYYGDKCEKKHDDPCKVPILTPSHLPASARAKLPEYVSGDFMCRVEDASASNTCQKLHTREGGYVCSCSPPQDGWNVYFEKGKLDNCFQKDN